MTIRLTTLLSSVLLCALAVGTATAQVNFASLTGTVKDAAAGVVPGAQVSVRLLSTGATRTTQTNGEGVYHVPGLSPGDCELRVTAAGFGDAVRRFTLEVGQRMVLDIPLDVARQGQELEVVAIQETMHTADASLGEVIEPKMISELPLNGRMLLDLALQAPGAHMSHGAQTGNLNPLYWRPGQDSAISIGGNRPNANYYLLDGAINTDPTFNTQSLSPSVDNVQEFKVQTGSYSAEFGGAGGGQINIITKSGSQRLHGDVYEFMRNSALDARSFNEMAGDDHLAQNQFGAALGGPVHGQTFFFANYEGFRMRQRMTSFKTVPDGMTRMGDFSMSPVKIYNPFTSRANPNFDASKPVTAANPKILRDAFENNVIPDNLINPVAMTVLGTLPLPNMADMAGMGGMMGAPGLASNNYRDVRGEAHDTDQGSARIDHTFSANNILFGRYTLSQERGFTPTNLPGFGEFHDNRVQNATISETHVFSPVMVNTVWLGFSRLSMHHYSENNFTNDWITKLGIQGVGFGGYGAYGMPWFAVQGYTGIGDTFAATPMQAWDTVLSARNILNRQMGRHNLKVGGGGQRYIWPMWGFFQNRGFYQFTNGFTTRSATSDGTGSALANMLLGLPAVRQRQAGVPSMNLRQWYAHGFVQDDWRATSKTTINIGVRYEYMSPLADTVRPWANLVFTDGKPQAFIGGQAGMPRGLMYANTHDFAPRFGIAQQLGHGFVMRAAYGIFYTPVNMNTWCNQLHNVPNVFPETNQSDNFVPSINGFDFPPAVLGKTTVSFASLDPHAPAQYLQQWSYTIEKSLPGNMVVEAGYQGSRGFHLQRAHLVNNAPPGPGPLGQRRPFKTIPFVEGTVLPSNITVANNAFPVSTVNVLENTARSWYDAGWVNVRRRYYKGLSLLANYTFAKNLTDAPDFRSAMFESSIPQDNSNLAAEKGPGCDLRHRLSVSVVYDLPALSHDGGLLQQVTKGWRVSSIFQAQTGFPLTISVFGDTANAGTVLGENPVRANYTGLPVFGPGTHTAERWFNAAAFAAPPAYQFGNIGRNTVYGPGMQMLDMAVERQFKLTESAQFQVRVELFNALNHVNLGTPDRFVNTPQFGTITMADTPGRQAQLSARFTF